MCHAKIVGIIETPDAQVAHPSASGCLRYHFDKYGPDTLSDSNALTYSIVHFYVWCESPMSH